MLGACTVMHSINWSQKEQNPHLLTSSGTARLRQYKQVSLRLSLELMVTHYSKLKFEIRVNSDSMIGYLINVDTVEFPVIDFSIL